jgi:hypothetical protein
MQITEQTSVQVRFTVKDGDHEYTDALYFAPEEHAALTPEAIEAMQTARFANWKSIVTAPPVVLTDEQKAAQETLQIDSMQKVLMHSPQICITVK